MLIHCLYSDKGVDLAVISRAAAQVVALEASDTPQHTVEAQEGSLTVDQAELVSSCTSDKRLSKFQQYYASAVLS